MIFDVAHIVSLTVFIISLYYKIVFLFHEYKYIIYIYSNISFWQLFKTLFVQWACLRRLTGAGRCYLQGGYQSVVAIRSSGLFAWVKTPGFNERLPSSWLDDVLDLTGSVDGE